MQRERRLSSCAAKDLDEMVYGLGKTAQLDVCGGKRNVVNSPLFGTGKRWSCRLFKTLYTNSCSFDCKYCSNSSTVKSKRYSYTATDLCRTFLALHRSNLADGIFLSSAMMNDPADTMEKLIECAQLLRREFKGYLHLKILPGASVDQVKQATDLADRVSINLEAPASRLCELSSAKDPREIMSVIELLGELAPKRHVTQFVVGAADETDLEILELLNYCYREMLLSRAYFSAFQPERGTPLENKEPVDPLRGYRLYNVDHLLRGYGVGIEEIRAILDDDGNLPREDPKVLIARNYFESPVNPNEASYSDLLRIPGIGPVTARRILKARRKGRIESRRNLLELGVILRRADPFIYGGQKTLTCYS